MTFAMAIASSASAATRGCTCRSQKFADSLRTGSMRTTRPPRLRTSFMIGTVWRLVAIGLRPQSSTRRLCSMSEGSWPARTPKSSACPARAAPLQSEPLVVVTPPSRFQKRRFRSLVAPQEPVRW
jgi:hypothetical protein